MTLGIQPGNILFTGQRNRAQIQGNLKTAPPGKAGDNYYLDYQSTETDGALNQDNAEADLLANRLS